MKNIKQWQRETIGGLFRKYLNSGWVFESVWEKIILLILVGLGVWRIIGWIL